MQNGETATRALKAEVDSAIVDIKETASTAKDPAYKPLARGVIVLLRVESVRLERHAESYASSRSLRVGMVAKVVTWAITAFLGAAVATYAGLGK